MVVVEGKQKCGCGGGYGNGGKTLEMWLGWCGSIRNVEHQKQEEGKGKSIFHDRESWPSRGRI